MSITETSITYIAGEYAYITDEGEFSARASMTLIDPDLLTAEQWEKVDAMHRQDRLDYALAIIHGDTVNANAIEKDNGL